ncbi:MAG: hypothetical protein U0694_11925 [Anaerolineae bacterium]
MGYQLSWRIPQRAVYLKLDIETSLAEFEEINRLIVGYLNQCEKRLFLMIDVNDFKPNALIWDRIRASQKYVSHEKLEYVLIVGQNTNRLIRLMMLVLFNISRAGLKFVETFEEADAFLAHAAVPN